MDEPNEVAPAEKPTPAEKTETLSTAALADAATARSERAVEARTFAEAEGAAEPQPRPAADDAQPPLFAAEETSDLRRRWDEIQASFVDEPRAAVKQADELVAGAMKRMAETFAAERERIEGQWDRGDDVSTEDLRVVLRRYRAFFGRLLSL